MFFLLHSAEVNTKIEDLKVLSGIIRSHSCRELAFVVDKRMIFR